MKLIKEYALMWPRKLYSLREGNDTIKSFRDALKDKPGIYVLYKGEEVFYIGKAIGKNNKKGCLFKRIQNHALQYNDKYSHSWDHFSAFVVTEEARPLVNELEGLIQFTCPRSRNVSRRLQGKKIKLPNEASNALKMSLFEDASN